jgi:hypothetical protein
MSNQLTSRLQSSFAQEYSPKGYFRRHTTVFFVAVAAQIAISAFMAWCSYEFWIAKFGGIQWAAILATVAVIALINVFMAAALKAYFAGDEVSWVIVSLCIGLMAFDIFANWHGIPDAVEHLAEDAKPTDSATGATDAVFQRNLSSIEADIASIKHKYYWCPTHKMSHSEHGKCADERYWMPNNRDSRRLAGLESAKATLIQEHSRQRGMSLDQHSVDMEKHEGKLVANTRQLRWLQGALYLVLIMLSYWQHDYGAKSAREIAPTQRVVRDFTAPLMPQQAAPAAATAQAIGYHSHTHTAGFPIVCDNCGTTAMHKRPPVAGHKSFCSNNCRMEYHKFKS